ncbi:PepSY domain-containing protein [Amycolatopsis taiwanensis]|uniref:PepSY domain-containing protein n=1 Tax=Amycolatopsis taiwanensis TaxID=342230 RepID=A0A9W6QXV0_9PSEU|nr:PepSY domain-containing protein [Amycolatopsis taiwanensis]GLY64756.1 hypothetical protein Atai01_13750 [Amycolatopsis taiwanensis]
MKRTTKLGLSVVAGLLALGAGGVGLAYGMNSEGSNISGPAADQARAAAAQAVPGGRASQVETGADEGTTGYGVTVTKPDGSNVEVRLDPGYHVLGIQPADQNDTDGG